LRCSRTLGKPCASHGFAPITSSVAGEPTHGGFLGKWKAE
jgi:hypothetical protein